MRYFHTMVLVCISLKTSEFGHLSVHLLVICMSFLKKYLFKALTYFLVFFFLLLSCRSSLYVLKLTPYQGYDLWIFSFHSIGCLFTLLVVFFAVQSFIVWCSPSCLCLLLLYFPLVLHPKNSCHKAFLLFSSRDLEF